MSKHTPGPLTVGPVEGTDVIRHIDLRDAQGYCLVARVYGSTTPLADHYEGQSTLTGNARLFAAAPTLRDHLGAVLCAAERSEEFIEGERGKGKSIEQLYADGEMPEELVAARAFLAQLDGEQP